MNKLSLPALLSLFLVPLLLLSPAGGSASTQVERTGHGNIVATVSSSTIVFSGGGLTLYYITGTDVFTGHVTGNATFTLNLLVLTSGADVGQGSITCTCTEGVHSGTIAIDMVSAGTYGGAGSAQASQTGSGGLAGLQGQLTFLYNTTPTGFTARYLVQYEYTP
ncbi:MAG: hypothetical protein OK442_00560 [Thaumarchaeota archaeon]|nr:hypothetical protein [Nitrososphaerota archaeon]